jgi:hypothetical protein
MRQHLTRFTRGRFRSLENLGLNDGCTHLADTAVPGAKHVPLWGADHYLMVPESHKLMHQLFYRLALDIK